MIIQRVSEEEKIHIKNKIDQNTLYNFCASGTVHSCHIKQQLFQLTESLFHLILVASQRISRITFQ